MWTFLLLGMSDGKTLSFINDEEVRYADVTAELEIIT